VWSNRSSIVKANEQKDEDNANPDNNEAEECGQKGDLKSV
jgi:hypothetical protein